ncbi:HNH endonuclease signature motif containing protein [Candidatus Poriferisodalis sp.]|uniref:HNH endonuclease signature motif containing protein n=1 Tax=Candidatus Poriferisodalis sp. TaxID=3101277 RepID=UPI003C6FBD58
MSSSTRELPVGSQRSSRRPVVSVCLSELRAGLAQRCETGEVRDSVDAVVGPLLQGPLVGTEAVRATDDGDLVWSAQQVQRALNALEGARSALAAEAARRRLHVRRGEASVAETLASATALSGAAARRVERDAVSLQDRPQVADALACGEINADQAAVVARAEVPEEVRGELCAGAKFDPLTGDRINRRWVRMIQRNWRSDKDLPKSQRRSVAHRAADALAHLLTADSPQGASTLIGGDSRDADPIGAAAPGEGSTDGSATGSAGDAVSSDGSATGSAGDAVSSDGSMDGSATDGATASTGTAGDPKTNTNAGSEHWVVPSSTQMIVLTTLDNLRNGTSGAAPVHRTGQQAVRDTPGAIETSESAGLVLPPESDAWATACTPVPPLLRAPGVSGVTETGTELSAAELRTLACDTSVVPVVMGGASEVLDVGRATRIIPPAIRRALIARDQGCVWPGCERAPIGCDGHHIQHWIDDGPTSLANLALLCHSHHHRLHEHNLMLHPPPGPAPPGTGWTVTPAPPRTPARPSTKQIC